MGNFNLKIIVKFKYGINVEKTGDPAQEYDRHILLND